MTSPDHALIEAQRIEIQHWKRQSDDWQKRGWELGCQVDELEQEIERLKDKIDDIYLDFAGEDR